MRYATQTDICDNVVLEKLDEPQEGSLLFDVPNPESDIDLSLSDDELELAFRNGLKRMAGMVAHIS